MPSKHRNFKEAFRTFFQTLGHSLIEHLVDQDFKQEPMKLHLRALCETDSRVEKLGKNGVKGAKDGKSAGDSSPNCIPRFGGHIWPLQD